jgi:hypothetical protein
MLRHRIVVDASLRDLVVVIDGSGFASIDTHELLKVLRVPDGIGGVREVEGSCVIDLFDNGDGTEARRLVEALRAAGHVVHHDEVT